MQQDVLPCWPRLYGKPKRNKDSGLGATSTWSPSISLIRLHGDIVSEQQVGGKKEEGFICLDVCISHLFFLIGQISSTGPPRPKQHTHVPLSQLLRAQIPSS